MGLRYSQNVVKIIFEYRFLKNVGINLNQLIKANINLFPKDFWA